jgi:hypothetical protein
MSLKYPVSDGEHLLELKRFKSIRVEWMKEDFREVFPYQRQYYPSPSFELSRRAFDKQPVLGECSIPEHPISDQVFLGTFMSKRLSLYLFPVLEKNSTRYFLS